MTFLKWPHSWYLLLHTSKVNGSHSDKLYASCSRENKALFGMISILHTQSDCASHSRISRLVLNRKKKNQPKSCISEFSGIFSLYKKKTYNTQFKYINNRNFRSYLVLSSSGVTQYEMLSGWWQKNNSVRIRPGIHGNVISARTYIISSPPIGQRRSKQNVARTASK